MMKKEENICGYWSRNKRVRDNQFLCREDYEDFRDGLLDRCPVCGRFKDREYDLCLDCYNGRPIKTWRPSNKVHSLDRNDNIEHSVAWGKRDAESERFFVYILK